MTRSCEQSCLPPVVSEWRVSWYSQGQRSALPFTWGELIDLTARKSGYSLTLHPRSFRVEIPLSPVLNSWVQLLWKGNSIVLIGETWKGGGATYQHIGKIMYKQLDKKFASLSPRPQWEGAKGSHVRGWHTFGEDWGEQTSSWGLCSTQKLVTPTVPILGQLFNQRQNQHSSHSPK